MLETVASILVFTLTVVSVSLAAAAALRSQRTGLVERQGTEVLDALLGQAAGQSYTAFLADSFTLPSPCPDSPAGVAGTSCVTILGEEVVVSWSVAVGTDPLGVSTTASASTALTASTIVSGRSITASRTLLAPFSGFASGRSLLRLGTDTPPPVGTAVFLLSDAEPRQVLDATVFSAAGVALFRVDPADCTSETPCVVSLDAGAVASVGGLFLDGPAARRGVVVPVEAVVQVPLVLRSTARLELALLAENTNGEVGFNPVTGSVCAWVSFRDGGGPQAAPACNDEVASRLIFEAYQPDSARADTFPVPADVPLAVSLDHPDGTCPLVEGMLSLIDDEWGSGAVCSSWTWGQAQDLTLDSTVSMPTPEFTLPAGTTRGTLRWAGLEAAPAAGFLNEPLWAKPRSVGSCAATAECTPAPIPAPEKATCPGAHCNSDLNAAPYLIVGDYASSPRAVQLTGTTTNFSISVDDLEGDNISVTVLTVPSTGVLASGDPAVALAADDTLLSGAIGGSGVSLEYTRSSPEVNEFFDLVLTDAAGNERIVEIALVSSPSLWTLGASDLRLAQNTSGDLHLGAWDTDGDTSTDTVSVIYSTGLSGDAEVVFDSGEATLTVTAADALVGPQYLYLVSSAGRIEVVPLTVVATPSDLSLTVSDVDQAGSSEIEVAVTDANEFPIAGAQVRFSLTGPDGESLGLRLLPAACRTGLTGVCGIDLLAEDVAPLGTFTVTASVGDLLETASAAVVPALHTLTADPVTLAQGGQTTVTVTSRDGAGNPFPEVPVTITAPPGITVDPDDSTTGLDGTLVLNLTADSTAAQGAGVLTVTSGTLEVDLAITVTATAATLTAAPFTLAAGTSGVLLVTVRDANSALVAGAPLTATAVTLRVAPVATASSSGVAAFAIVAPRGTASGTYSVTVEVDGLSEEIEVVVS
jgi:hypothetical protein